MYKFRVEGYTLQTSWQKEIGFILNERYCRFYFDAIAKVLSLRFEQFIQVKFKNRVFSAAPNM